MDSLFGSSDSYCLTAVGLVFYRSKAVAVQAVSMMIPLNPEVTIRNSNVSVLVAQSPEEMDKQKENVTQASLLITLGSHCAK